MVIVDLPPSRVVYDGLICVQPEQSKFQQFKSWAGFGGASHEENLIAGMNAMLSPWMEGITKGLTVQQLTSQFQEVYDRQIDVFTAFVTSHDPYPDYKKKKAVDGPLKQVTGKL